MKPALETLGISSICQKEFRIAQKTEIIPSQSFECQTKSEP